MKEKLKIIAFTIITAIILSVSIFICGTIYIKHEKPDDLYIEMKKLNDSYSLIGLSKEAVIEILGEPMWDESDEDTYSYNAGHIFVGLILGNIKIFGDSNWYVLNINFDEMDKVKATSISYIP